MITVQFLKKADNYRGVSVSGHAGFADLGHDVACASVSSALQTVVNLITEIYKIKADIKVEENLVFLKVEDLTSNDADLLLKGLLLQIKLIQEEFPRCIKIKYTEV
ncbi:MAG: ribosomal-processing cysteine protease Prp [Ruminococcus sp.]|nr:ribosomal-processing cysteine protease Prp [Ruminococcus sp.]